MSPSDANKRTEGGYKRLSKLLPKLGLSRRVLYYWARQGMIPGVIQLNGVWLYREADVDEWLQSRHADMEQRGTDFLRMRQPRAVAQQPNVKTVPAEYQPTSPAAIRLAKRLEELRKKQAGTP